MHDLFLPDLLPDRGYAVMSRYRDPNDRRIKNFTHTPVYPETPEGLREARAAAAEWMEWASCLACLEFSASIRKLSSDELMEL